MKCLYATDKTSLRNLFNHAAKLCIEHPDIDVLVADQTKTLALRYTYDDDHSRNYLSLNIYLDVSVRLNIKQCGEEIASCAT